MDVLGDGLAARGLAGAVTGGGATGSRLSRLPELAALFFKLGVVGFGGPAAHIAMMEDEVVERRRWLDRQHFLDLVGATNLIPGPNSTEMAIHVGFVRAGWPGLLVAGGSFILPAVALTGSLAWAYVVYGSLPEVQPFLAGIQPAVVVIVLGAVVRLGRTAVARPSLMVLAVAVSAIVLAGANEVAALVGGGVVGALIRRWESGWRPSWTGTAALIPFPWIAAIGATTIGALGLAASAAEVTLGKLSLFFLKVGSVLYGSGYVLVAFLEGDLVARYGWLSEVELLDAIAVGQFTPGPVLSTSTFIGYLLAGTAGAVVATLSIFLPSFVFVAILNPVVPRLRESAWAAAFLDGVNASAVALMAAVTIRLGMAAVVSWETAALAVAAAVATLALRIQPAFVVVGAAVLGWLLL